MNTITQSLKNAAVNGCIPVEKAIKLAGSFDQEREETVELLKMLEKHVGMYQGEIINEHLAKMNGTKFNAVEYHYEAMPTEQRI